MICPICRRPMMKCKRYGGGIYYFCTFCGIEVESTSE